MTRIILGLVALSFALASCTRVEGLPPAADTTLVTAASTTAPAPDLSVPQPLGDTISLAEAGTRVEVTVQAVYQDSAPDATPPRGGHWASANVQTCVKDSQPPLAVGYGDWLATDASGGVYRASAMNDKPSPAPRYPETDSVAPGACVSGWVMFPVAFGAVVETVAYRPNPDANVAWAVG